MAPPPARLGLLLATLATATLAVFSYFVVRRRQIADRRTSGGQAGFSGDGASTDNEKLVTEVSVSQSYQAAQDLKYESDQEEGTGINSSDEYKREDDLANDSQDQTSFIVIDNGEGAVPSGNNQNAKKSDRSSDESSYDVIEDEQEVEGDAGEDVEKDEGGHAIDDFCEQKQPEQDTFLDPNETSMIIIKGLDQTGMSKSESSLYASADESVDLESRLEEPDDCEEEGKKVELMDVPEVVSSESARPFQEVVHVSSSGEASQTADVHVHLDQAEISIPIDHPVHISDQLLVGSPAAEDRGRASITAKSDFTQAATESRSEEQLSASDVTEILTLCQNSPSTVSKENIHTLVHLLSRTIPELHSTVLNCVLRVAAFTQNVKSLRESGCLKIVADQIQDVCQAMTGGGESQAEVLLGSLCQVLTNLTLDPKSQIELEDTVPSLIDLLLNTDKESVKLSVLRPLINFSSQASFHIYFTRAVQALYTLLNSSSHMLRVQTVKVLVNLSLNKDMVPHMLAAKAPSSLVDLLDLPTPSDLTLRTLTMLANMKAAMHKENLSLASLPVEDKAASHETMYIALHGVNSISTLRSKVFRLTRHNDEDVAIQASKLYQYLQQATESDGDGTVISK